MLKAEIFARREFEVLEERYPNHSALMFKEEILALCKKVWDQGLIREAEAVAVISEVASKLCVQEPVSRITGDDDEWGNVIPALNSRQNQRCYSLFKEEDGKCHYNQAIRWRDGDRFFYGSAYLDLSSFRLIGCSQRVYFPFTPKTFCVDVVRVPVSKRYADAMGLVYHRGGEDTFFIYLVKDSTTLEEVNYYYHGLEISK